MTNDTNNWRTMGGDNIWLPYAQMKTVAEPLIAQSTQGCRIRLKDGREMVDGIASWWTACHGYNHPHIVEAMKAQLDVMPHIMFGGLNHEPALRLAKRLATITPGDLSRVFFSDSGSTAVEVAMKMAVQYWVNKGVEGRTRFVHFRNAYHGDTMATMTLCAGMSITDPGQAMHKYFRDWMPQQIMAELPMDDASTDAFDALLQKEQAQIAAVIIEPLVQGAGGMKFHDAATLKRIGDICAKHNILLIADEVFTGFGRTGAMFACEQAGIVPDIMCLGKALTGGAVGLAATLARRHVFDAFWLDDPNAALMHGPTYMANPLACAAANASLDLFEREPRLRQVAQIEQQLREGLEPCRDLAKVADVRVKGAIGVIQMTKMDDVNELKRQFARHGVWIRPFGDIVYLTPAFTISADELKKLTDAIYEIIRTF